MIERGVVVRIEGPTATVEICDKQVESCAFNDLWKRVAQETRKILQSVTLADMAKSDTDKKNSLITCLTEEMQENAPEL